MSFSLREATTASFAGLYNRHFQERGDNQMAPGAQTICEVTIYTD
jgi:hypothetical protein